MQQRKEVGQRLVAKAKEIGDDADVFFGEKMSSKKMEFIKDQIKRARLLIDDAAKFGFRSFLPILAAGGIPGFIVSAFSEVATAKPAGEGSDLGMGDVESLREQVLQNMDFSRPSESSKLLNELQQSVKNMSNGGIATINNMTRPVGFSNGGETGFLTGPPPGMEFKPTMTMEYRDFNQNGKEDRSEGLYLPRDFQPITKKEGPKKIFRMPERSLDLTDEQKKRLEMQKIIRDRQRKQMGLPEMLQLLGSN
jgi:gas vesicle protein